MHSKKIIYIDGGLASQMGAYSFYLHLKSLELNPQMDFVWYKRHGLQRYKLKEVFNLEVNEYKGSFKYDIYISKNIIGRILRKTGFIKGLIKANVIPKLYYTSAPKWGGIIMDLENLPKDVLDKNKETYLWGYWPIAPYVFGIIDQIREAFTFPDFEDLINSNIAKEIQTGNSVSIHVRRGDYLDLGAYEEVTFQYYETAIKTIQEKVDVLGYYIFSDDIEWCKENFSTIGLTDQNSTFVSWNKGDQSFRDMQLMSLCKHNITANSGFSMWAALLNKNNDKIVTMPKHYMNEETRKINEDSGCKNYDLGWIVIDN